MITVGFDTSNYTTSIAYFDGLQGDNKSRLLDVRPGELGLRQSDAVFAHIKRLPELADALFGGKQTAGSIGAIGVSTRPRAVEGSYMPCFLAGVSAAKTMAAALDVPCYEFSHQQGHIAAALWSAGKMDLIRKPHLAWHLSGGTTELLLVEPAEKNVIASQIGGTTDISAGQVIDRAGKLLGLPFPSGRMMDMLSSRGKTKDRFKVKTSDMFFSLSGLENKIRAYGSTHDAEETAAYTINSVCYAVHEVTLDAMTRFPGLPVVFSGGVASNATLRSCFCGRNVCFAEPALSSDNAFGIAVLTWLQEAVL